MNAAPQPREQPELLSWDEIKARYPDQYVCLVDVERPRPMSGEPGPVAGRVIGHGDTWRAAYAAYQRRGEETDYGIYFTDDCIILMNWPRLIIDDATRELLNETPKFYPSRR